jgi:hypothetical protein
MTHPDTARMINKQIAEEFEKLNSIMTRYSDKEAIMKRIAELKAMLDEDECMKEKQEPTLKELALEFIHALRERRSTTK